MCGIIAIHSRPSLRPAPTAAEILQGLDIATALDTGDDAGLAAAADATAAVDLLLRGVPGVKALVGRHELVTGISARLDQLDAAIAAAERRLETTTDLSADDLELTN